MKKRENSTPSLAENENVLAGKSKLLSFVLGIFIGLAVIVPGISGSTIAIILGLYAAMLYAIGHLASREFKKCFLFLLPLGIGAVIGFVGGFLVVATVFEPYTFELVCLFTGLMAGAVPALFRETEGERLSVKRGFLFAGGLLLPIVIALLSAFVLPKEAGESIFTTFPIWRVIVYFPLGILIALTQIIPGLSATAILMAFGQYGLIIGSAKECVKNIPYLLENPEIILLYASLGLGFLAGLLLLSRALSALLEKYKGTVFFGIIGLSVGSIVSMYLCSDMMEAYESFGARATFPWWEIVIGVLLFAVGFTSSYLLVIYEKKHAASAK